ncbi:MULTISPECIES: hypothetical protein [Grimontia]|uniref:Uncharacterized protein n=1 Tax=Grimontia marina TaxID=646534 RepID=A0A128FIZ1_9GAMM|nr:MULTISPECIES: hypothetical protein [Grimontia]WRW00401.1 hypothetical protein VP504_18250 [Grimontia sp. NTOU-MAR1]CZF86540.1 hypothetical protein GMA8713_04574 [Grimontia marina]
MEELFSASNIKSTITLMHIIGLIFGLGGAWFIDGYIILNRKSLMNEENLKLIEGMSKFVVLGVSLLWISGLSFVAFYYFYTPEFLGNEKVIGKAFIVMVLTINGFLIHSQVMKGIHEMKGKEFAELFDCEQSKKFLIVGTVSFVSWLFPLVIGVSKSLNFSTPATSIILFYLLFLVASLMVSGKVMRKYMSRTRCA